MAAVGGVDETLQEWLPGVEDLGPEDEVFAQSVLLGCGGFELEVLEDYLLLRTQLAKLWSGEVQIVMGCSFLAKRPGLVEAVSQHALEASVTLHLGVDGTWWLKKM